MSNPVMLPEVKAKVPAKASPNPGDPCPECNSRNRTRTGLEAYGLIALVNYGNRLWCRQCLRFET